MKTILVAFCLLLLASSAFYGCQSVATTSAKLRNQEGNYDIAIKLANEALAQNPNDAEAYFQLGVSYSQLDSVSLAFKNFIKALELDPKRDQLVNDNIKHNYAKHYTLGQKAFGRNEFEPAAEEFKMATLADPRQAIGFYNLGISYARIGETDSTYYDRALVTLDKVLELSTPAEKHYIDALRILGRVLATVGRVDEAAAKFNRLVEEDPTNYGVIESLGSESSNKGDWEAAAVFLDLAAQARAKIGAEDADLYYNLGVVNFKLKDSDPSAPARAVEYYQKSLDLRPDDPQTILSMLFAYYEMKEWIQAVQWGEKYVALLPDGERGWQILSISYKQLGEDDKAMQCALKYDQIMKAKGQT
ncbi:MAG: tetratricopeptide repeat protein, partial [Chitinivibrionia bacterium]|nr:tetratricopeptide repeat protein [Chitinivibrionia bacterium]